MSERFPDLGNSGVRPYLPQAVIKLNVPRHSAGVIAAVLLAGIVGCCFAVRAWHGLWFIGFNDETEHLLGGWALARGDRLYDTFVDLHGPVIFLLAEAYGRAFGWAHNNYARVIMVAFMAMASAAVFACPSLPTLTQRLWAVTLFAGLVTSIWIVEGLYLFEYYFVSACLITVLLAGYVVPCWRGVDAGRFMAVSSGVCGAAAVFTSHAWMPTVVTLYLSSLFKPHGANRPAVRPSPGSAVLCAIGFVFASALCLVWLYCRASLRGYVVFHILFAHTVYLQIVPDELTVESFIRSLTPSLAAVRLPQDVALAAVVVTAAIGFRVFSLPALTVGLLGVLGADARGKTGFAAGTFTVTAIALMSLTVALSAERATRNGMRSLWGSFGVVAVVVGCEIAMRHALSSPGAMTRPMITQAPPSVIAARSDAPQYVLIRKLLRPEERMLSLVFRPADYWAAGRLPIDGFYEYLPTDALYARHPMLGMKRDLCAALRDEAPPVIIFDDWNVWGRFPPEAYMRCLITTLKAGYTKAPASDTLFVRNDRVPPHW